ncbi:predicted protein [Sclerotinia sclerotiorum 1980 UF-70]|uniref:Uncharacterized protein n=1 Tax=Sclerotinia sclerotiorum (strain ATCC 18683 / 1980 / Ss-1) TaxID=665079 RepID=A7E461_SCLS1|nr:predicted protein [Sclerotinia sclerotiorum 1980 UF-70]EDN90683.1 predicted protein [Sclerotinia sclerotiorum 1980 UF-70]
MKISQKERSGPHGNHRLEPRSYRTEIQLELESPTDRLAIGSSLYPSTAEWNTRDWGISGLFAGYSRLHMYVSYCQQGRVFENAFKGA